MLSKKKIILLLSDGSAVFVKYCNVLVQDAFFLPEKDLRELTLKKFNSKANFKSSSYKKKYL